jgi:serine/threonine-protein kinase
MVPAALSHYRILGQLGAGGMGEVYLAEDTKLGRRVALKVLAHEMAADPGRRARFEREARAVAALNHPNIVTIHSVEEQDGLLFLTMELVEGRTLDQLIPRQGMAMSELLALALPLADAIGTAHQRGITHRDLKPANLMVGTKGRVKVLDFGLAKMADSSPLEGLAAATMTAHHTGEGRIVGTVAYMSPEQAQGMPVDSRSDVFALGILLFEMATGERPFKGDTHVSLLSSILKDTPASVTQLRPDLPTSFVRIVKRCLAKDPDERYQTGKDLHNELRALQEDIDSGTAIPASQDRSSRSRFVPALAVVAVIAAVGAAGALWYARRGQPSLMTNVSRVTVAVLPFENFSSDAERDYLSDGIAEETIAALGQVDPGISVIARTSTLGYRGTKKSIAEIGRELGADYVVEGSIRSESGRLRVTSRLVRAGDQSQMWSKSYDREPTSVLATQLELSSTIAEQISLRLSPDRVNGLSRRQTTNADAYDLYLRGRYLEKQRRPDTNARAIQYYQEAIKLDPGYALAWAAIATTYADSPINGDAPPTAVAQLAREAAKRAFEAGPDVAEVQHVLANIAFWFDFNWAAAEALDRKAVSLDPHNAEFLVFLGHALTRLGRYDEAQATMGRARELDPLEPITHALSSQIDFEARDYTAAEEHARRATQMAPDFWIGYVLLGQAYGQLGETTKAIEALTAAARLSGNNSKSLSLRGHLLAKVGRTSEARAILTTLESRSREHYVPPYALALVHAGLGDRDEVFTWLNRAVDSRDVHLVFLPVDAKWDPYADDPRFGKILTRCGFTRPVPPVAH